MHSFLNDVNSIWIYYNHHHYHINKRNSRFFTIASLRRKLSPTRMLKWSGCYLGAGDTRICNESYSSGRQSFVVKTLTWTLHVNCSTTFFHTCHAYRHHWLLPFCTTVTDLDLAWELQDQRKVKRTDFIFLHTFHLIKIRFNVMKQLKLNILRLLLSGICWNEGHDGCFYSLHQQNLALACIQIFINWFDSNLVWC